MTVRTKNGRKRRKPRIQRRTEPGATPGSITASPTAQSTVIQVMAFGPEHLHEQEIRDLKKLSELLQRYPITWIHVSGLGSVETIAQIGSLFQLHALALEDVVNVHQRPKVDPYEDHLFIVARMCHHEKFLETEQVSIFLGDRFVLTFQERLGDCLDPVRERIRRNNGRVRKSGPDYLAYAILDTIIDSFFPELEHYADVLDDLDDAVTVHRMTNAFERIHAVRNDLPLLRRTIRPLREAVNELIRDEHPCISPSSRVFLRDCYDHVVQLIDLVEVYRETCIDLRDYYLAVASNRMNEIMKVLTIIATIFIPLGFIAGLYGMNFEPVSPWNMPELRWAYGYPFALGLMGTVAASLVLFFQRRGWLSRPPTGSTPLVPPRPGATKNDTVS